VTEGRKAKKMLSVYKAIAKTWSLIFDEVFLATKLGTMGVRI